MKKQYVYTAGRWHDGGFIAPTKIGISACPSTRMASLQTSAPFKIRQHMEFAFPDREWAVGVEDGVLKALHRRRLHGEWINVTANHLSQEVALFILAVLAIGNENGSEAERYQFLRYSMGPHLCR